MVPIIQDNAKRIIPVVWVVINSHTIGSKLIRINKWMSHVTAKIKAFIDDQNICLSGDWVDILGCNCCNWNVRDDIKGVVKPFTSHCWQVSSTSLKFSPAQLVSAWESSSQFAIGSGNTTPSSIFACFIDCWLTFCLSDWTAPILLGSLCSVSLSPEDSSLLKKESSSLSSMEFPSVTLCCSGCCTGLILDTLSLLYPSYLWP